MHTATQLRSDMFSIEIDGRSASPEGLLPDWSPYDRLGVVVAEPYGALGASLLLQLSIALFYEIRQSRRDGMRQYPEAHLFHVGARHGNHSSFDFWPERKEVDVDDDADAVLSAINAYAITRLVVVDGQPSDRPLRFKEPEAAFDRISSAFAYSASGRVPRADVTISGLTPEVEANTNTTLDLAAFMAGRSNTPLADPVREADRLRYSAAVRARLAEVPDSVRELVRQRRDSILIEGLGTESYRRIPVREALQLLAPR